MCSVVVKSEHCIDYSNVQNCTDLVHILHLCEIGTPCDYDKSKGI